SDFQLRHIRVTPTGDVTAQGEHLIDSLVRRLGEASEAAQAEPQHGLSLRPHERVVFPLHREPQPPQPSALRFEWTIMHLGREFANVELRTLSTGHSS